jgi:hypothetical protein
MFEYRVVALPSYLAPPQKMLDQQGEQGFELVAIDRVEGDLKHYVFKRALSEGEIALSKLAQNVEI